MAQAAGVDARQEYTRLTQGGRAEWKALLQEWRFSNLLEILRLYAASYCRLTEHAQACISQIHIAEFKPKDKRYARAAKRIVDDLLPRLHEMRDHSKRIGLEATAQAFFDVTFRYHTTRDMHRLRYEIPAAISTFESELERRVCLVLPRISEEKYESPLKGWELIVETFPDVQNDVEEMNKCLAFGRDAAAIFHVLLVVEAGLIQLGKFLGVKDRKPGWDATSKSLQSATAAGRSTAPHKIRKHFSFLELVAKDVHSMKMAWRNKVSHADNHLFLMTSDFRPEVADKIITACHGFMLLLATEGPLAKNKKPDRPS